MKKVVYNGRIIQVVEEEKTILNSNKVKVFEYAKRSPGVRAIITKEGKILLSKEYRYELNDFDYRLPGGKVFDSLAEYVENEDKNLKEHAKNAVIKECFEEVGLRVKNPKLLHISKAGATVVWDLYYFEITDFTIDKQHLEEGEIIEYGWYDVVDVKKLILNNQMHEDRSVGVVLKYILKKTN